MKSQFKKLDYSGQQVFVGLDVHKKTWKVATCTEHSNPTHWPVTIERPFVRNLKKYLDKHYPRATFICAYEAGFCGFWIHDQMEKNGLHTLVVHAADIPTSDKQRKQKEDKRDARKIAKTLKSGDIEGIHVPSKQAQEDRSVVRERYSIAKSGRRIKAQIKSHLALYGIEIPEEMTKKHCSGRFVEWLEQVREKYGDRTLSLQLERLYLIRDLQLKANKALRDLSTTQRHREVYPFLLTIPGVGPLTAMLLIGEMIDMKRFANFDNLSSYVGFIPTTDSSADTDRVGNLTKRRNIRLRSALIESSWSAIKSDPELLLKYEEYRKRMC